MEQAIAALSDRGKGAGTERSSRDGKRLSRDELYQRLGWMPRVHPLVLPSGRWILPLYSDTFSALDHGDLRRSGRDLDGQPALDRLRQHPAQPGAEE